MKVKDLIAKLSAFEAKYPGHSVWLVADEDIGASQVAVKEYGPDGAEPPFLILEPDEDAPADE